MKVVTVEHRSGEDYDYCYPKSCGSTDKAFDYDSGVANNERMIAIHVTRKSDTIWRIF